MKNYKYLLLDLDGTIIDPIEGITRSVAHALYHLDIEVKDLKDLSKFIGPPLRDSFKEFYGLSEEQIGIALSKYRERYAEKGVFENTLYEGIEDFLKKANQKGYELMLATSKPLVFAQQILEEFHLNNEFAFIGGAALDGSRDKKADVIRYVLDSTNITNLSEVVMIGDRKHDILGAKEMGIDSIGVLHGYGDFEELNQADANYIVANVNELEALLF